METQEKIKEPILYLNGVYCPASQAKISVFDHVVLYGGRCL